jgi:hypothetical protein
MPGCMKRLALTAALAGLVIIPASASAWTGSTFRSPTGNLVCKWRGWTQSIACGSYASQKIVGMTTTGRPKQGLRMTFGDSTFHTLSYDNFWSTNNRSITCWSRYAGIRCTNQSGWAFFISRNQIDVYYRGSYVWSL